MSDLLETQGDVHERRRQYIRSCWEAGQRLSDIAHDLGLTRERVGQILGRAKAQELPLDYITTKRAAHEFGLGRHLLSTWDKLGWIAIRPNHTVRRDHIAKLIERLKARPCWKCGRPINRLDRTAVSCSEHHMNDHDRLFTPYSRWSERHKAHHRKLMSDWEANNHEKAVLIQKRSSRVYTLIKKGMTREEATEQARREVPYPWRGEA